MTRARSDASGPTSRASGAIGIPQALLAAVLFGIASPAAKRLLDGVGPVVLSGFLYLGAGLGLSAWWLVRRATAPGTRAEAGLARRDVPALCGAVVFGGMLGPVLQMVGLSMTPASTASLLLNLEGVFTALLAWLIFREHVDVRIATGMALIVAGGVVLGWTGRIDAVPWGSLAIAGACLAWGIDNNVTRHIAGRDAVQIAAIKGLAAGGCNLAIGLEAGGHLPPVNYVLGAALLGLSAYGASLVLFVLALRHVGAARTSAYFSLAPFIGAVVSVVVLGDAVSGTMLGAALLMGAGIYLHVSEHHAHEHAHAPLDHDHRHVHDEHHRHGHHSGDPEGEPHAHPHHHDAIVHAHRHYPDDHHRHPHAR